MRSATLQIILLGAILMCAASANAQKPRQPKDSMFFPLMAWDYATDAKSLKAMSDCGVNAVAFVRPNMLDTCQKLGLKAVVFDESISVAPWDKPGGADAPCGKMAALVRKVGKHPAVYGYHLKDEPNKQEYAELGRAAARVRELAPDKWPYINLLPGTGNDYEIYVEEYIRACKPPILSFDNYSLAAQTGPGAGFWTNIAQIREASLRHNIPFHSIVLTSAHWMFHESKPEDIRLQCYGSLVYGAKGLAFYKFMSEELPILGACDLGNFRMGPLDQFREKTVTWEYLRNTNRQILNLAPTLLKLRSDDVYHIANTLPERNHAPTSTTLLKALPPGEYVIGDFTHEDGSRYAMIVNRSLSLSCAINPEYNRKIRKEEYVSAITGKLQPFTRPYFWLAPGQGVLMKLTFED